MTEYSHKNMMALSQIVTTPERGSPSSVLPVFGRNLRFLTSMRGTHAKVSTDLDIGRIQFQRYLRGESFPKPHILKKICDYFGVDARILTDPLTNDLLSEMLLVRGPTPRLAHHNEWLAALGYAVPDHDYFDNSGMLDEGVYVAWQWCGARKNTVLRRLFKITKTEGALVTRGYTPSALLERGAPLRQREYRGVCLSLNNRGYVLLTFFPKPLNMISTAFVTPMCLSEYSANVFVGFTAITREELPDMPRLSRIVIEKLDLPHGGLFKQAKSGTFFKLDEIPKAFADVLGSPIA